MGMVFDEPASPIATASRGFLGRPATVNVPSSAVNTWRGSLPIMLRVETATRTWAEATGSPPPSTTLPAMVAPAVRRISTPSVAWLPSSVTIALVPGANFSWRATKRKLPAGSAGNAKRPSAPVTTPSLRSSACRLQSDAPENTTRAPGTAAPASSMTRPATAAPGVSTSLSSTAVVPTWVNWPLGAKPGALARTS